jgi:hypothetical protein
VQNRKFYDMLCWPLYNKPLLSIAAHYSAGQQSTIVAAMEFKSIAEQGLLHSTTLQAYGSVERCHLQQVPHLLPCAY